MTYEYRHEFMYISEFMYMKNNVKSSMPSGVQVIKVPDSAFKAYTRMHPGDAAMCAARLRPFPRMEAAQHLLKQSSLQ